MYSEIDAESFTLVSFRLIILNTHRYHGMSCHETIPRIGRAAAGEEVKQVPPSIIRLPSEFYVYTCIKTAIFL